MKTLILLALIGLALTVLALLASGCQHDGCATGATRCRGQIAQVCNVDGDWVDVLDCAALTQQTYLQWVCAPEPTGDAGLENTCVLEEPNPLVASGVVQ